MYRFPKYLWLLLLGLVLGTQVVSGLSHAADPPLSLDDYWQQLQQTQALIASLIDAPSEIGRPQLLATADRWEGVNAVILPDGIQVPLDHSFLVSQLRADPPDLNQLNGLLTTLLATRQSWLQGEFTPQDLEALTLVLARPEFQWPPEQPSLIEVWLQRLLDSFLNLVTRLLPDGIVLGKGSSLLNYVLTGLVALILASILFYISRDFLVDFVTEGKIEIEAEKGDEALTASSALKRAQALSNAGDYRTAVRYLYLSSLLLLEERGLLRYDRSRTNREYLRSVAHLPQLATALREVVEVFDQVWYGYQPLDESAYDQYTARIADLDQQVKQ